MALSLQKLKSLQDASLVTLFNQHHQLWQTKAEQAFGYTHEFIQPNQVRQDDVVPLLRPVLEVSDELRDYLAGKKLRQKYWSLWFAELIVDQLWRELNQGG